MRKAPTALAFLVLSASASAQDVRREVVLDDFVPDIDLLERIAPSEIGEIFSGMTFAGIYQVPFKDDQRFVEIHHPDGVADYLEGSFSALGKWGVEDGKLCFRYPDDGNRAHCWTMYRYGGCIVAYEFAHPVTGLPLFARDWGYIQTEVADGFAWPERAVSEDDVFACEFAVS